MLSKLLNLVCDRVDHAYLKSLRAQAKERCKSSVLQRNAEQYTKAKNAIRLIDADELLWKLKRKMLDGRLDDVQLLECLRDWGRLALAFSGLKRSLGHDLDELTLNLPVRDVLERYGERLGQDEPQLARALQELVNEATATETALSWVELEGLVAELRYKHRRGVTSSARC